MTTEVGPVELEVPRDRDGSFEPKLVRKRQRRLRGVDAMVISLCAKGLTTGEIQAHLAEVYDTNVSKDTISKITDAVAGEMSEWFSRPLDCVYPVIFLDAIFVKVRDGQVTNQPFYVAIGVTVDGKRDILGIWAGGSIGGGPKWWHQVLTEVRNRGVEDVCMVVCDGLRGLPDAIEAVWPRAVIQTCVIHLLRNTFRLASRRDWDAMARDLRPVYTAPTEHAAKERLVEFHATWGEQYPAIKTLWDNVWADFVPFLDYSPEIRRVIYSSSLCVRWCFTTPRTRSASFRSRSATSSPRPARSKEPSLTRLLAHVLSRMLEQWVTWDIRSLKEWRKAAIQAMDTERANAERDNKPRAPYKRALRDERWGAVRRAAAQ